MKSISIKWRIFLLLLGFCSLLLLILWLFQVVFLDSFYRNIKIKEIKNSASTIVKNIDSYNLAELADQISINKDICIEILMEDGREFYSSDIARDCIIHKMPPLERARLLLSTIENGGELLEYYNRDSFRDKNYYDSKSIGRVPPPKPSLQQTIIYSKILTNKEGKRVVLFLNSIISPVNATIATLRTQLYYITGLMLLFSILLAFVIAKRVSKPIITINESAKNLAKGNYKTVFKGSGYKEIDELSNTLNHAAKELSKVETLRHELIANISHDLRTPLTLISGYAEAMRDLPDEMSMENAQIIVDETKRLTTLVNDVLDISKIQSGMQEISPIRYNLTLSISNTVERVRELVRKDGYGLNFIYDEQVSIVADETKISQAFYNLLINAINYTGSDKTVTINQTVANNRVKIEVIDTGEGISQEYLPYIWDRYFKIDKHHRRAVAGTGLGLSIVKSIMDLHGGEYGVLSKPSYGSIFWFSLKI